MLPTSRLRVVLGPLLVFAAVGCGTGRPAVVPASGRVLMNGKPLVGVGGFVRVVPVNARVAIGAIDKATGGFTLTTFERDDGCVRGTHGVAVIANAMEGERLVWILPEKYADAATSGLTVTVDGPSADLTIELEGIVNRAPRPSAQDLEKDTPPL